MDHKKPHKPIKVLGKNGKPFLVSNGEYDQFLSESNDSQLIPKVSRILIVADGPSSHIFKDRQSLNMIPNNVKLLAVNGVISWLPRVDFYFTLDPDKRQYSYMQRPRRGVTYFAAVPDDYGTIHARSPTHQVPKLTHVRYLKRISGEGTLIDRERVVLGINKTYGHINTGNSAWGALGLAHHMGCQKVALIGVDGCNSYRSSGGKSRNLSHLSTLFQSYNGNPEVINLSRFSNIRRFPKFCLGDGLKWLEK